MPPKQSNKLKQKPMAFRLFKKTFQKILSETPLPEGDIWKIQTLQNAALQNDEGWMEMLYRTRANYQCDQGHYWQSSWSMILFRFYRDVDAYKGTVLMKRFGQRCKECPEDDWYYVGLYTKTEVCETLQWLLLYILQKCYEMRPDCDVDAAYFIIPVTNVPSGRFGGAHRKDRCEACAYNQCQEKYKKLTKKK